MALHEPLTHLPRAISRRLVPSCGPQFQSLRRNASSQAQAPEPDDIDRVSALDNSSPLPEDVVKSFDPVKQSKTRNEQLPSSRYKYRSPKYNRGPLHPHRPPPEWDPSSRRFVPGPFSLSRVQQTYDSTIAEDILTLSYVHIPPGFKPPPRPERLRSWDDSSPYHKNRQLRGPRGGDVLRLIRKPITFRNVPKLERITVHSYVKKATESSGPLHVAGMAVQAITNVRVETHKAKTGEQAWGIIKGKQTMAVTADLYGEDMLHFFGKLVDVLMPKIKDWKGIKGTSGDSSGNISFGLEPSVVALFPEIEVNYDMYPPEHIPGCHITFHTSARTDKDARLLLGAMGVPFYGKFVN